MAEQSFAGARMGSKSAGAAGIGTKVAAPSSKPSIGRKIEQPMIGKQKVNGGTAMGTGSKGKGQGVKTVPSNPIQGSKSPQKGNTAMGTGGVINGFV